MTFAFLYTDVEDSNTHMAFAENVPGNILELLEKIVQMKNIPKKSKVELKDLNQLEGKVYEWFHGDGEDIEPAVDSMKPLKNHEFLQGPVRIFDLTVDA